MRDDEFGVGGWVEWEDLLAEKVKPAGILKPEPKPKLPPTENQLLRVQQLTGLLSEQDIVDLGTEKILKLLESRGGIGVLIDLLKKRVAEIDAETETTADLEMPE